VPIRLVFTSDPLITFYFQTRDNCNQENHSCSSRHANLAYGFLSSLMMAMSANVFAWPHSIRITLRIKIYFLSPQRIFLVSQVAWNVQIS
jgi:hypothetical protein